MANTRNNPIEELEWRHEAPKLLAAYSTLWDEAGAFSRMPGTAD